MRHVVAIGIALAMLASGSPARADETDVCVSATVEGQKLQRAGKLVAARDRFLTCARAECPADIVTRCEGWARGVSDSVPSLVIVARDAAAHDLAGVRVRIDGGPPADRSARAIELDPGEHRVVVEREGFFPKAESVILHEGEKNRPVYAVLRSATASSASEGAWVAERPVPTRVWIGLGVAAVGLASFGVFAAKGANDRLESHCDVGCPTPVKNDVDRLLLGADISLGVGIVALGVATWMFLTRPTVQRAAVLRSP